MTFLLFFLTVKSFIASKVAANTVCEPTKHRLPEGSRCTTQDGQAGKCRELTASKCPSQLAILQDKQTRFHPVYCGWNGPLPIVCCAERKPSPNEIKPKVEVPVTGRRALDACSGFEQDINSTFVPYIIGGEEAGRGEFPHMVALGYRKEENEGSGYAWDCGGTLISSEWVLTAAHCLQNAVRGQPEVVWVGVHNLTNSSEGRVLQIIKDVVHPQYQPTSHYFDMALLKVPAVLFDSNMYPACLYTKMDTPKVMTITGWGIDNEDFASKSNVLLKTTLNPVAPDVCNRTYSRNRAITSKISSGIAPNMICARGAVKGADSCNGDSGGPLQALRDTGKLYNLIGVTSFGVLCGGIGVYDRVASFLDWIEPIVWPV